MEKPRHKDFHLVEVFAEQECNGSNFLLKNESFALCGVCEGSCGCRGWGGSGESNKSWSAKVTGPVLTDGVWQ